MKEFCKNMIIDLEKRKSELLISNENKNYINMRLAIINGQLKQYNLELQKY